MKKAIYLCRESLMPQAVLEVSRKWTKLANAYGDVGSCVLGAEFEFTYQGQKYELPPHSQWQGSCSWEASVVEIKKDLEAIGCKDVRYHWGNMD